MDSLTRTWGLFVTENWPRMFIMRDKGEKVGTWSKEVKVTIYSKESKNPLIKARGCPCRELCHAYDVSKYRNEVSVFYFEERDPEGKTTSYNLRIVRCYSRNPLFQFVYGEEEALNVITCETNDEEIREMFINLGCREAEYDACIIERKKRIIRATRLPYLQDWMVLDAVEKLGNPTNAAIWNQIVQDNAIVSFIVGTNPTKAPYDIKLIYWEHCKEKCDEMTERGLLVKTTTFGNRITYSHYRRAEE